MRRMERLTVYLRRLKKMLYSNQGLAFLLGIFVALVIPLIYQERLQNNVSLPKQETELSAETFGPSLNYSEPIKLRLPKLDQVIDFSEPLGLKEDGTVEVPKNYTTVGWYKYSLTPGQIGPAIVLGHVDSYQGPAVFFRLKELTVGDDIFVDRANGSTAHFKVDAVELYKQSEFPTDLVYGKANHAALRLITCTGIYSHGTEQYSHNLVVYASLAL